MTNPIILNCLCCMEGFNMAGGAYLLYDGHTHRGPYCDKCKEEIRWNVGPAIEIMAIKKV